MWFVTQSIKKFRVISWLSKSVRKPVLVAVVAGLSFLSILGQTALTGGELDPASVETMVQALTVLLMSTGGYHLTKSKGASSPKAKEEEIEEVISIPIRRYRKP